MKSVLLLLLALLSAGLVQASDPIDLPIQPIVVARTATVLRVNIKPGASIREAVAPIKDDSGNYGRKLRGDILSYQWLDAAGNIVNDEALAARLPGDIIITGAELVAAGAALGKPWDTAKGADEEAITLLATVQALGDRAIDNAQARAAWVSATFQALASALQSGALK